MTAWLVTPLFDMSYFCQGFATALSVLVVPLLIRYIKDAFRAGIRPETFSE